MCTCVASSCIADYDGDDGDDGRWDGDGSGNDKNKGKGDEVANKDEIGLKVTQVSGGAAQVEYTLPEEAEMTLSVYNVAGRRVATIAQGRQPAGTGTVKWTAPNPVPTVYFVQLKSGNKSVAKRIFFINR